MAEVSTGTRTSAQMDRVRDITQFAFSVFEDHYGDRPDNMLKQLDLPAHRAKVITALPKLFLGEAMTSHVAAAAPSGMASA